MDNKKREGLFPTDKFHNDNKVVITGNIYRIEEKGDKGMLTFQLSHTPSSFDKETETYKKYDSETFFVTCFPSACKEDVMRDLRKYIDGDTVTVRGRLRNRKVTFKDGAVKYFKGIDALTTDWKREGKETIVYKGVTLVSLSKWTTREDGSKKEALGGKFIPVVENDADDLPF